MPRVCVIGKLGTAGTGPFTSPRAGFVSGSKDTRKRVADFDIIAEIVSKFLKHIKLLVRRVDKEQRVAIVHKNIPKREFVPKTQQLRKRRFTF